MNIDEAFEKKWKEDSIFLETNLTGYRNIALEYFRAGAESQGEVIKSLKEDLKWALTSQKFYIKHWNTETGMESIREKDAKKCDELKAKHGLDV